MPPWKPVVPSVPILGERGLTPAEVALLASWVKAGMPRGKAAAQSPPITKPPPQPDAVWSAAVPFEIPAEGSDLYRCFVIPTRLNGPRWVDGFVFQPGNRRVVHHALAFFDSSGAARRLDAEMEGPGYPCFGTPGFLPTASLGGWSPGNGKLQMPPGTAVRAPAHADLVLQIHYHPTGKPETDQSGVGVFFRASPPERKLLDIPLTSRNIDIPAGLADYRVRDHFELPVAVTLWQIIPHAHFVARQARAWAVFPNGVRRAVLTIRDWDFRWQAIYQLRQPLRLPAGTRLEMEFRYDNSARNPRNPNSPPRRVTWGPGAADEMAGMHWNVTVDDEEHDLPELTSSLWGKMMRSIYSNRR
jgi:hypothetical protein